MRTLIIHPEDPTTAFLRVAYGRDTVAEGLMDSGYLSVITDPTTPNKRVVEAIRAADAVVMLGHGSPFGLMSIKPPRAVIGSNHVYLLRDRVCVGVWCHADKFFKRYGINGYSTGMVVSESDEADHYINREWSVSDIEQSNAEFAEAVRLALDSFLLSWDAGSFRKALLEEYAAGNPVKDFNLSNL